MGNRSPSSSYGGAPEMGTPIRDRLRRLFVGKTERRLALVILITTMVPLGVALYIGTKMFEHASNVWFNPEIGDQLDRGVVVYQQYVKAVKDDLDHQTQAIAADPVLRDAAKNRNIETLESELDALFPHFHTLLSLSVEDQDGQTLAKREGSKHVDPEKERARSVRRALSDGDPSGSSGSS